jgi:hypothetical protein
MKSLTKLTLTALFAVSALMIGSAYAADQATEAAIMDCSRLPADATKEPLRTDEHTLCLYSLHNERSAHPVLLEQAYNRGREQGYRSGREHGFLDGRHQKEQDRRNYSRGYSGGYGGD